MKDSRAYRFFEGIIGLTFLCLIILSVQVNASREEGTDLGLQKLLDSDVACGIHCLYTAARLNGVSVDMYELAKRIDLSEQGTSLWQLKRVAEELGFQAVGYKYDLDEWHDLEPFTIVHLRKGTVGHFMLVGRVSDDGLHLADPPSHYRHITSERFKEIWTGSALELSLQNRVDTSSGSKTLSVAVERVINSKHLLDLGPLKPADQRTIQVVIQNDLPCQLGLEGTKASCGCMVTNFKEQMIAPGSNATFSVKFGAASLTGLFQKQMLITLQAERKEFYATVVIKGKVLKDGRLYAFPEAIQLETWPGNKQQPVKTLVIRREANEELQLLRVTANKEWLVGHVAGNDPLADQKNGQACLRVTVKDDICLTVGNHSGTIRLETCHPRHPTVEVPIALKAMSPIEVHPPSLFTRFEGMDTSNRTKSFHVMLRSRSNKPFTVRKTFLEPASLGAVFEVTSTDASRATLKISVMAPVHSKQDTFMGKLHVFVDHPHCEEIVVPIMGMIVDRREN
jgi:hypothetical protein